MNLEAKSQNYNIKIKKNSSIIEEQYRKAVIKDIPITKVYEDKNCSFIIQPTKKAYI